MNITTHFDVSPTSQARENPLDEEQHGGTAAARRRVPGSSMRVKDVAQKKCIKLGETHAYGGL